MAVSRAGYYKWKNRDKSKRQITRENLIILVKTAHEEHPSHGYRWIAHFIRFEYNLSFSDNFVFKIFKYLGIRSETKHKIHLKPRKERDKYPNLIFSTWETVDRSRQVIVSDMTALHVNYLYIELTMYFDVFTKQIVAYSIGGRRGDRMQYIDGLNTVLKLLEDEGCTEPVILHTDQGSVYASMAYNELIKDKNIIRSMSRAGKPTDNPVNESLNGWIKEELFMDFKLGEAFTRDEVIVILKKYIDFYNTKRPCYAIGYNIPDRYYQKFMAGELEKKDTFSNRVLTPEPKFVQALKAAKETNKTDDKSSDDNE